MDRRKYELFDPESGNVYEVSATKEEVAALDLDHHRRYRLINSLRSRGTAPAGQWSSPALCPPGPGSSTAQELQPAAAQSSALAADNAAGKRPRKGAAKLKFGNAFTKEETKAYLQLALGYKAQFRQRCVPMTVFEEISIILKPFKPAEQLKEKLRTLKRQFNTCGKSWYAYSLMYEIFGEHDDDESLDLLAAAPVDRSVEIVAVHPALSPTLPDIASVKQEVVDQDHEYVQPQHFNRDFSETVDLASDDEDGVSGLAVNFSTTLNSSINDIENLSLFASCNGLDVTEDTAVGSGLSICSDNATNSLFSTIVNASACAKENNGETSGETLLLVGEYQSESQVADLLSHSTPNQLHHQLKLNLENEEDPLYMQDERYTPINSANSSRKAPPSVLSANGDGAFQSTPIIKDARRKLLSNADSFAAEIGVIEPVCVETPPPRKKTGSSKKSISFLSPQASPKRKQIVLTTLQWPANAVQVLVLECVTLKESVQVDEISPRVWKELSAALARQSFKITAALCKSKFETLNNYFLRRLLPTDGMIGGKKWPYYKSFLEIHDIPADFSFEDCKDYFSSGHDDVEENDGEEGGGDDDYEDDDGEGSNNATASQKRKRFTWCDDDILLLLNAFKSRKRHFLSTKSMIRTNILYAQMAAELNQYGLEVNGKQCRAKMSTLKATYSDEHMKQTKTCTGQAPTKWNFYEQMVDIFGRNASLEPPMSISVGRGLKVTERNTTRVDKPTKKTGGRYTSKGKAAGKSWAQIVHEDNYQQKNNILKQLALMNSAHQERSQERGAQLNLLVAAVQQLAQQKKESP